jgi:hypothetical protein
VLVENGAMSEDDFKRQTVRIGFVPRGIIKKFFEKKIFPDYEFNSGNESSAIDTLQLMPDPLSITGQ